MKALLLFFVFLLTATACGTTKVITRLVAAKCPVQQQTEKTDQKLYEHVPEHAARELSCDEAKRLALVRLTSVQQCNAKLDKLKEAQQ